MKIARRESTIKLIVNYKDGCKKIIRILKYYNGDNKKYNFRCKIVEFINSDGTINEERSNTFKGNMEEDIDEYKYPQIPKKADAEMETIIYYTDGSTETIKNKIAHIDSGLPPFIIYNAIEPRSSKYKINKEKSKSDRKYIYQMGVNDFKNEKSFKYAFDTHVFNETPDFIIKYKNYLLHITD